MYAQSRFLIDASYLRRVSPPPPPHPLSRERRTRASHPAICYAGARSEPTLIRLAHSEMTERFHVFHVPRCICRRANVLRPVHRFRHDPRERVCAKLRPEPFLPSPGEDEISHSSLSGSIKFRRSWRLAALRRDLLHSFSERSSARSSSCEILDKRYCCH